MVAKHRKDEDRRTSFNGAMAVRPWMAARPAGVPNPNPRFNGAMAVRPWMADRRADEPPLRASFNGAMAVRPWMGSYLGIASSGPKGLQWGHGREAMDGAICTSDKSLNLGFNGAMAVRPWMASRRRNGRSGKKLQWGHGREAMDGFWWPLRLHPLACASMGPWP